MNIDSERLSSCLHYHRTINIQLQSTTRPTSILHFRQVNNHLPLGADEESFQDVRVWSGRWPRWRRRRQSRSLHWLHQDSSILPVVDVGGRREARKRLMRAEFKDGSIGQAKVRVALAFVARLVLQVSFPSSMLRIHAQSIVASVGVLEVGVWNGSKFPHPGNMICPKLSFYCILPIDRNDSHATHWPSPSVKARRADHAMTKPQKFCRLVLLLLALLQDISCIVLDLLPPTLARPTSPSTRSRSRSDEELIEEVLEIETSGHSCLLDLSGV